MIKQLMYVSVFTAIGSFAAGYSQAFAVQEDTRIHYLNYHVPVLASLELSSVKQAE